MPNRILRDWTDSEKVNALDFEAEVFFVRLIQKADDYGRFSGDPRILRSLLFPLKDVSVSQVTVMCQSCVRHNLIRAYVVDKKPFIEIHNFNQRLRLMKEKHPAPPICQTDDGHVTVICQTDDGVKPKRRESESESEEKPNTPPVGIEGVTGEDRKPKTTSQLADGFQRFWLAWPKHPRKTGRSSCVKIWQRMDCEKITDHIITMIEAWKQSENWTKDGGAYIPMPETWLRQSRWDTEPENLSTKTGAVNGNGTNQTGGHSIDPKTAARRAIEYERPSELNSL